MCSHVHGKILHKHINSFTVDFHNVSLPSEFTQFEIDVTINKVKVVELGQLWINI